MKLYLVRHGDALDAAEDSTRSLSPKGREESEAVGQFLQRNNIEITQIYHSAKDRAIQTANILAAHLNIAVPNIGTLPGLQPDDSVRSMVVNCNHWQQDTMLVGHLPYMGKLAAELLSEREDRPCINFQTSAVLCLERIAIFQWCLSWFVQPSILKC